MKDSRLWLGIDGGGTRSVWCLCDDEEQIIETRDGPPLQASVRTIPQILDALKSGFLKYDMDELKGIGIGISGLAHPTRIMELEQALTFYVRGNPLVVHSDAHITHMSTFNNSDGTLIVTGTGSIVLGRKDGTWHRKGGWGPAIGDPASGHAIGTDFLKAVLDQQLFEKYHEIFRPFYQEKDYEAELDIIRAIYNGKLKPSELCPSVFDLAESGDEVCVHIVERQVRKLMLFLEEISQKTGNKNSRLALHGGLTSRKFFIDHLKFHILKHFGSVSFVTTPSPTALSACRVIKMKVSGVN